MKYKVELEVPTLCVELEAKDGKELSLKWRDLLGKQYPEIWKAVNGEVTLVNCVECADEVEKMQHRCIKAAKRYLRLKGYDTITVLEDSVLVAVDCAEKSLVFCKVSYEDNDLPKESDWERSQGEQLAFDYLRASNVLDKTIRFDRIDLAVGLGDKAFLRHHINCFS